MTTEFRDTLQETFGSAYAIQRELGGGGMARVFVAEETALGRLVVVKVLSPELTSAISAERFRREVSLAAGLHHPHIVPLLTAGATPASSPAGSLLYYTMPYVEGESLRARLSRAGAVPVADAVRALHEVAEALHYAHGRGVVHRDIKPDNVLLASDPSSSRAGHALITDFGVAKAVRAASESSTGTITHAGVALGTPAYMAPEQGAADPDADHRVDIYAYGVMAYEMLAGRPPFQARSSQALLAAHALETPLPLQEVRADVSAELSTLVMRCLEKQPDARPQSAAEILSVLEAIPLSGSVPSVVISAGRSPGVPSPTPIPTPTTSDVGASKIARRRTRPTALTVAGLVVVAAASLFAWRGRPRAPLPAGDEGVKTLAVLPFDNLGDSTDRYFADGVTDEVRGKLATLPGLRVVARTSSEQYRGRALSPQQIGRELGVEYLLSGTVRWEKRPDGQSRVRVSPQLVRASTALATWQQPFDATLTDVFQVQADIASRVAQSLDVALGAADRGRLATRPTRNLDAYDAYLRAEQLTEGHALSDPATMRAALGLYEQAVKLDSGFATAWARMSEASTFLYRNAAPLPEHARRAQLAAERAVGLAPADARGYAARGLYYATVASDNERALAELRRAGELAPQDVEVLRLRSEIEAAMGRSDIALEDALRAVRLDPRNARSVMVAGRRMRDHRRYHEADSLFERAQELAPRSYANLLSRITNRLSQGDLAGARALIRSPAPGITRNLIAARLSNFSDLYWVPDSAGRAFVLGTEPDVFDDDVAVWAFVKAEIYALEGDRARSRIYADSARRAFMRLLVDAPNDAEERAMYAVSLAYLGRFDEALREGERAASLVPQKRDLDLWCYVQFQLVRIHLLAGQHARALDRIETIVAQPWYVTPAWLRIDPTFDPIRGDPRFQRIAGVATS